MITGINHVTLSVRDLQESFAFYTDLLGFRPRLRWPDGAYLTAGSVWLVLTVDSNVRAQELPEYTHLAFAIEPSRFREYAQRLRQAGAREWKSNSSEGESLYFLDPNGHKLELHYSDLESRLADARERKWADFEFFE